MGVKLVDNTAKVQAAIKVQIAQGINNAAQFWVTEAKDLAPVDTGFLKEHIGQTVSAVPNNLHAEIRSLAPYSQAVNFGGPHTAPQPYWTISGLLTRQKFAWLLKSGFVSIGRVGSAGANIIRAALEEFHGPMGRKGGGF
jgi:hypothetical protein